MTRPPGLSLALAAAMVCLIASFACAGPDREPDAPALPDGETAGAGAEAADDRPVCLQVEPFVANGPLDVRVSEPGDAHRVGALRWESHDGCERLVIDLEAREGEAAERAGRVAAEVLRDLGVVRVDLRDVGQVDPGATDASFDGPLARQAYAVFSPEGRWVFVDVHMGDAAEASVTTLDGPARVVVDLRPGGSALAAPAPSASRVVVLEPRPGTASYPLTVTGYARTFEANVVVRLEQAGQDAYDDYTTATAWADAWGHYTFTIPDGPTGRVVLHVGEHSAKDGTWEGVEVELEMSRR
jgi:hypothetical protein